ncbi:MAG TPA: class I SAM-dependent rRNA methyltransferase [Pirellulaceae bacterium]
MSLPQVHLRPRKAQPFFAHHPWVLDTAIARVVGSASDGAPVDLLSDKGPWIARGLYNQASRIRVRLYSWNPEEELDASFWRERIQKAIGLRVSLGLVSPTTATRLVFSEADRLSGLVVDRFGPVVVIQPNARGIAERLDMIVDLVREATRPSAIVVRVDASTQRKEGMQVTTGQVWGDPIDEVIFVEEHGLRYGVEVLSGQKTGFYLDQRENRRAAAALMHGRSVLDVCCYSGGFALAAAKLGQATDVLGIDVSEHAVALARANADLNGIANAQFRAGDMFESMEQLLREGRRFGAVILDPPKFVKGKFGAAQALRAYHHLNRLGIRLLEPDGILVTCSCSGSVGRLDFSEMLFGVSTREKRDIQVLAQLGAAPDHPTLLTCPETEYLKCFLCRVG